MYINGYVRSRKMKRLSLIAAFAAVANATLTIVADASVPALIPMPREMKLTGGSVIFAATNSPKVEVVASIPPEGYELSITKDGVTIRHSDFAGLFYAKVTLEQLRSPETAVLPCLEIKDSPAFRWRGVHLDDSRRFFGREVVKLILEQMPWYKLNVFHWHLTDDQYWSLEIPEYPELVKSEARKNVIGGQCCNWTSHTWNRFDLEWKLWPRGFALAEVLWTYPDSAKRDFAEFSARAAEHRRRLIREGVNCAPLK